MNSCMNFRKSDKKTLAYFDKKEMSVNIRRAVYNDRKVRFIETGCQDDDCPLVLFVHGAPGASDAFLVFLKITYLERRLS